MILKQKTENIILLRPSCEQPAAQLLCTSLQPSCAKPACGPMRQIGPVPSRTRALCNSRPSPLGARRNPLRPARRPSRPTPYARVAHTHAQATTWAWAGKWRTRLGLEPVRSALAVECHRMALRAFRTIKKPATGHSRNPKPHFSSSVPIFSRRTVIPGDWPVVAAAVGEGMTTPESIPVGSPSFFCFFLFLPRVSCSNTSNRRLETTPVTEVATEEEWRRRGALRRSTRAAARGAVEWPHDGCPLDDRVHGDPAQSPRATAGVLPA
jgi:hypothetical protein